MILLAALLCNYGRGKCLIIIGTEGPEVAFKVSSYILRAVTDEGSEFDVGAALSHQAIPARTRHTALGNAGVFLLSEQDF